MGDGMMSVPRITNALDAIAYHPVASDSVEAAALSGSLKIAEFAGLAKSWERKKCIALLERSS